MSSFFIVVILSFRHSGIRHFVSLNQLNVQNPLPQLISLFFSSYSITIALSALHNGDRHAATNAGDIRRELGPSHSAGARRRCR